MKQLVVPCGYMGSGSSAITDIMKEIRGYSVPNDDFEYVFLHCPNGVFDLEDKLLLGNNALRSDEAIHAFLKTMKLLFDKKNYWVGSYNEKISCDFFRWSKEFINSLGTYKLDNTYWYYQQIPNIKISIKNYMRRGMARLSKNKILMKTPLRYEDMLVSYPTQEQFYSSAQKFIDKIICSFSKDNIVMDQLLLPQNLCRVSNYFNEELKVIVVDRDPRDVFISNKYVWKKRQVSVPYPTDVKQFCEVFTKHHQLADCKMDKRILRINFEDLIYKYNEMLKIIYEFLEISSKEHVDKGIYFNPDLSINNTALFADNPKVFAESKYIEEHLQEYLYDFPNVNCKRKLSDAF